MLVIVQEGEKPANVRILGIKSFDTKVEKDIITPYGQAAIDSLERLVVDRPIRVMLNSTPKDRYGRYIATLYVDNQDLGLKLIKEGLALAYTVYPFPAMSLYLQEQELARAGRKGLWANKDVAARALALINEWQRKTE
jgi:micrococcal nuclease